MEYRDVHNILPGSYSWRTPSPASEKVTEEFVPMWFDTDYKTSFRNTKHYIRRIRPNFRPPTLSIYNFPITDEMVNGLNELIEDAPSKYYCLN